MSSFGTFKEICTEVSIPLCGLIEDGLEPVCFARNVEINGTILFQAGTTIVHAITILMVIFMIYRIKGKYTAVGRKEMVVFFYLFLATVVVEFIVVFGLIPLHLGVYSWAVAIEIGLITATLWCLMLNGFVAFQWADDGTQLSVWSLRISSLVIFVITGFISIATFNGIIGLNPQRPTILFIIYFILNGTFVAIYVVSQALLVIQRLDSWWPLGDLGFGVLFFGVGQIALWVFSVEICDTINHSLDGMFFGAIFHLLAIMMVYKYWDSITKDDLEMSLAAGKTKFAVHEVNEPLMKDDAPVAPQQFHQPNQYTPVGFAQPTYAQQQPHQQRPQY